MNLAKRAKAWLVLVNVTMLVLVFLAITFTYTATHISERYRQLPPGASTTHEGITFEILELVQSTKAAIPDSDPELVTPGSVWLFAKVQVTMPVVPEYPGCELLVVGPGGRAWPATSIFSRELPDNCGEEVQPGEPYVYEAIFEVPERYANEIRGIAVKNVVNTKPDEVLSPAR